MCTVLLIGRVPKIHLLRPEFVIVITFELMVLIKRKLLGQTVKPDTKLE
jgi:hypothetical protein